MPTSPDDAAAAAKAARRAAAEFSLRVFEDGAATMTILMAALGDRLGLFRALAEGPANDADLAARAGCHPRYVREWANAMTTAGYLDHDPGSDRYSLPALHAPALVDEGGTLFQGGMFQNLFGIVPMLDAVTDAFRTGDGIESSRYPADCFEGMARVTGAAHDNVLVPRWIPTMPDVEQRLRAGCRVADVGCGQGRALVAMASAFPASTFVGYDPLPIQLEAARERAASAGVSDRISFEQADALAGLPGHHDLIWLFDVVHDTGDPVRLLAAVRAALDEGGSALILEPNAADTLAERVGPDGAFDYGVSVLYCLPVARAAGAEGMGTCGSTEAAIRSLCAEAGFASVDEAPIDNRFNRLWHARR